MTSTGLWATGTIVSDRYQIESFLDQGAAGEVYAARNVWTDRPVAVKRLQPKHLSDSVSVERFLLEGRVGGRIEHPNVVQTFDMGRDAQDGSLFIVQELLRGAGMREVLTACPKLPLREALDLLLPILGAVHTVHQHGIVHRDIKPENIFLADGPLGHRVPKLLDFGIAKVRLQETLTQRGTVLGTLDYMAPEQLLGDGDIDRRVDIWALGVVFYELLCGALPFEGGHVGLTVNRILTQDPQPITERAGELPAEIHQLIMASLNKDRQRRPQTVQDMLEAVLQWAASDVSPRSRRLIDRHRSSIPALLEARFGQTDVSLSGTWAAHRHASCAPSACTPEALDKTRAVPIVPSDDAVPSEPRSGDSIVVDVASDHANVPSFGTPPSVRSVGEELAADESGRDAPGATDVPLEQADVLREEANRAELDADEEDETTVGAPPVEIARMWEEARDEAARRSDGESEEGQGVGREESDDLAPSTHDLEIEVTLDEDMPASISASSVLGVLEALASNRFREAVELGDAAVSGLSGHPEAQAQVRLAQAVASFWLGDFTGQQRFGIDGHYLTVPGTVGWLQGIGEVATASGLLGEHQRLWDLMSALRSMPASDLPAADLVVASCKLGLALHRAGWPEHVETVLCQLQPEAFDVAQENGPVRGWLCMLRGELAVQTGDQVQGLRMLEEAKEAFAASGDARFACLVQSDIGQARMDLGEFELARELQQQALVEAERLGIYVAVTARLRLGAVCGRLGDHDEGLDLARAALEASQRAGDWCAAYQAHVVLSDILAAQGDLRTAEIHARSAVDSASPSTRAHASALGTLSLVLADRPMEALLAAAQAMEMLQAVGGATEGEARIRLGHAFALRALGHNGPAKQAIETAYRRVLARAEHIQGDDARDRFLHRLKEHAATLDLAKREAVAEA
jgi:serine/threonine protein kinase/tetratricopeptide (TPR) repeat protein